MAHADKYKAGYAARITRSVGRIFTAAAPTERMEDQLAALLGVDRVLTGAVELAAFATWQDFRRADERDVPRVAVMPTSPAEAQSVVRLLAQWGWRCRMSGGGTAAPVSDVAAAIEPRRRDDGARPACLISTRLLTALAPPDRAARTITVGAGATPSAIAAALSGTGLELGIATDSDEIATIGGLIAMDAHGTDGTRRVRFLDYVDGLTGILPDGTRFTFSAQTAQSGLVDLPAVLLSSPRARMLIVEATLALRPARAATRTVLAWVTSVADGAAAIARASAVTAAHLGCELASSSLVRGAVERLSARSPDAVGALDGDIASLRADAHVLIATLSGTSDDVAEAAHVLRLELDGIGAQTMMKNQARGDGAADDVARAIREEVYTGVGRRSAGRLIEGFVAPFTLSDSIDTLRTEVSAMGGHLAVRASVRDGWLWLRISEPRAIGQTRAPVDLDAIERRVRETFDMLGGAAEHTVQDDELADGRPAPLSTVLPLADLPVPTAASANAPPLRPDTPRADSTSAEPDR
ncbi:MAG: FAD-binding oxidoreductase [Pseudomonadota bacterium]